MPGGRQIVICLHALDVNVDCMLSKVTGYIKIGDIINSEKVVLR